MLCKTHQKLFQRFAPLMLFSSVLVAGCNSPDAPKPGGPTTNADTIKAVITFDRVLSDTELRSFLSTHKFRLSRYLLYAGGLFGADGNDQFPDSVLLMSAVRARFQRAAALASASLY